MESEDRVWRERGLREAVLAGDEQAWRLWYDESCSDLYSYLLWRCGGLRDRADEVAQETWLTAVRRLSSFDPAAGSFAGWLRGIAANLLRNHFRRDTRRQGRLAEPDRTADSADAEILRREQAEAIARALARLPEHYESVLRAKYLDGQSMADIALVRGDSIKSVESLLTRAETLSEPPTTPTSDPMHDNAPDPLAPLLAPRLGPSPRREEIFSQTLIELRCRRRLRRFTGIAVLIAAYGAGLLTVLAYQRPMDSTPVVDVVPSEKPAPAPVPSAPELEWEAMDHPESAPELYRQAADQYLGEADPAEAARCYGNSLDAGKSESLSVHPSDSWLLMAIKNARKKERNECGK